MSHNETALDDDIWSAPCCFVRDQIGEDFLKVVGAPFGDGDMVQSAKKSTEIGVDHLPLNYVKEVRVVLGRACVDFPWPFTSIIDMTDSDETTRCPCSM